MAVAPARVLVLRALGLGDLLTALPALRALRDAFARHELVLATRPWLEPLAYHTRAVDRVLPSEPLAPLPRAERGPDVAVNLHGRGPQSHRVLLALAPAATIAFANDEAGVDGPEWRESEHEVARWCRLLAESGIPADASRLELRAPDVPVPSAARGATVIHPGASAAARRWPPERYAAVARGERAAGRRVVVTAGPGERGPAETVARAADGLLVEPSLLELAAVVAAAGRVVCGDTGIAHLATALGTPSVVLFGPVAPACWGPPSDRDRHRALWSGRTGDPHADAPDAGLLEIGVDDVLAALATLPALRPAA